MPNDRILEEFQAVFRKLIDQPDLTLSRDLAAKDVEGWDSLFNVSLIVAIERHFKIKIKLGEVDKLRNVGDMVDLIDQKTAGSSRG